MFAISFKLKQEAKKVQKRMQQKNVYNWFYIKDSFKIRLFYSNKRKPKKQKWCPNCTPKLCFANGFMLSLQN